MSPTPLSLLHLIEDFADDFLGGHVVGLGLVGQADAVTEHVVADGADVFRNHVAAALDEGVGLGSHGEADAGARRCSARNHLLEVLELVLLGESGGEHDVDDVALDLLVHVDVLDHLTGADDVVGLEQTVGLREALGKVGAHDKLLLVLLGVVDDHLEHEAVDLRLGQRIGSLLLYRVLRGHHKERLRQLVGGVADGHLALLHGFEQRALHLGRGAVDFVGQHEVGEDGALLDHELLGLLAVDERAQQVGRQEVGGELNAREVGVHNLGQSIDGQCFGQTRHAFEQNVAVRQQADEQTLDKMLLAHYHFVHFERNEVYKRTLLLDALVEFFNIHCFHFFVFSYSLPLFLLCFS